MFKLFKRTKDDPKEQLKELLEGYELPSFPSVVMQVLSLLRDPGSDVDKIAETIKIDPGLNIKVLKTVNSAAFGLSSKVTNVEHAVTLLGRARLEALVLSVAIKDTLPEPEEDGFDSGRFWRTAAKRAALARSIAERLHPRTQAESFTAGLLQDMAVPVLADLKGKRYVELYQRWTQSDGVDLSQEEQDLFGYDHQTVGALMAEAWQLPEYLKNSIGNHHAETPEVEPAVAVVAFVKDVDTPLEQLKEHLKQRHGLPEEVSETLIESATRSANEFSRLLG